MKSLAKVTFSLQLLNSSGPISWTYKVIKCLMSSSIYILLGEPAYSGVGSTPILESDLC